MNIVRWLQGAALCAGFWGVCAPFSDVHATVVEGASIAELVHCAELIVDARVLSSGTRVREHHGRMMPFTFHHLQPLEVLHGMAGEELVVMEPGGSSATGTSKLSGAPRYVRGERVLAFLVHSPSKPSVMRTCGLAQGKFTIEERAGMWTARRELAELAIIAKGKDALEARADEPPWELAELERTIQQLVSAR